VILSELPRSAAVIVGEPTDMQVAGAHKGICGITTTIRGREAHSSDPQNGVNAIQFASALVSYLYRLCDEIAATEKDERFDPPFTTFNAGKIVGGDAVNIIAREVILNWEFRPIPGADPIAIIDRIDRWVENELLRSMRGTDPNCSVTSLREFFVPPFDAPESSFAKAIACEASNRNSTDTIAFVTEASLFERAGVPSIVCGPGDIAQAHQPDEFIKTSQMADCIEFLGRIAERFR
jgi:acetylornithine deacetylase